MRSGHRVIGVVLAGLWLAAASAGSCWALVNTKYTPVDLVRQAEGIVEVEVSAGAGDELAVKTGKALKGDAPKNLALRADAEAGKELKKIAAKGGQKALLFFGDFSGASLQDEGKPEAAVGALQVGTAWFLVTKPEGEAMRVVADPLNLKSVWAGNTTMLARAIEYIQNDPRADVPVGPGFTWAGATSLGKAAGKVHGCRAMTLVSGEPPALLVMSDGGDRLFRKTGAGKVEDVTAKVKLASKSSCAVGIDWEGSGKLDLVTSDGKGLVHQTLTDGAFAAKPMAARFDGTVMSLAGLDVAGKAGLVVGTSAGPVLVTADGKQQTLGASKDGGPCVVADFDGDGVADVVQVTATGLSFYKGKGAGAFAPAAAVALGRTEGVQSASVGDLDGDGMLDILLAGRQGAVLAHNLGGGKFEDLFDESGEVPYVSKPESTAGVLCDFNGDGRQDIVLTYQSMGPQLYYARGFATFGHAITLDLAGSAPAAAQGLSSGQVGGAVGDFDGDGSVGFAFVGTDGQVVLMRRDAKPGLCVTAALPAKEAGPVRVVATDGKRLLGAQNVTAESPAVIAKSGKGMLTLTWKPAEGPEQKQAVMVMSSKAVELKK